MGKPSLLIIGVGSIGERHLRCAKRIGCSELAICEINADLRCAVADRYEVSLAYSNIDEALTYRPQAAIICVPAHLHIPYATLLAERGIHVLIEKPLSISMDGIEQLQRHIANKNCIVAVAYVQRVNLNLIAMRNAIQSGRFGRPIQLVASGGQNFPFYRPAYRTTYYKDRATGGGAIQDALTHTINTGEWLIGPVDRVLADAKHQGVPDVDVEDTVHVIARQQGIPSLYSINQYQTPNEVTITVVCERGTVRYEFHENRWRWITEPGNAWHDETEQSQERDDLFAKQLETFFDSIERGTPPMCSLDEGIQSLKVNLAILRALESQSWTSV